MLCNYWSRHENLKILPISMYYLDGGIVLATSASIIILDGVTYVLTDCDYGENCCGNCPCWYKSIKLNENTTMEKKHFCFCWFRLVGVLTALAYFAHFVVLIYSSVILFGN